MSDNPLLQGVFRYDLCLIRALAESPDLSPPSKLMLNEIFGQLLTEAKERVVRTWDTFKSLFSYLRSSGSGAISSAIEQLPSGELVPAGGVDWEDRIIVRVQL